MVLSKNSEDKEFDARWKMYFNRVANLSENRIVAIIISLKGK